MDDDTFSQRCSDENVLRSPRIVELCVTLKESSWTDCDAKFRNFINMKLDFLKVNAIVFI